MRRPRATRKYDAFADSAVWTCSSAMRSDADRPHVNDLAVDDWETMICVNTKGVLFAIAAALPVFRNVGPAYARSRTQGETGVKRIVDRLADATAVQRQHRRHPAWL